MFMNVLYVLLVFVDGFIWWDMTQLSICETVMTDYVQYITFIM